MAQLLQKRAVFGSDFGVFWGTTTTTATLSRLTRLRSLMSKGAAAGGADGLGVDADAFPNSEMSIISAVPSTRWMAGSPIFGVPLMEGTPLPPRH